jgi:nicotinamide-nucleotide amidase
MNGETELESLARRVGAALLERGLMLATAESCTGGWVAQAVTAVAGSSQWFERGFVTYSNEAKQELLGVRAATLEARGAVSEATVLEMAAGALAHSRAGVALSISGVAGPAGGTPEKPVGTVWHGWALAGQSPQARRHHYDGDRESVRRQAVITALAGVLELLEQRAD